MSSLWGLGSLPKTQSLVPNPHSLTNFTNMKLFGTSGIRGLYGKEISLDLALKVGRAVGTYVDEGTVVIGRDPRTSSLALENAVVSGIESAGVSVVRLGMVPTPVLAFAARKLNTVGVMITASHNPPEYNGIKLWNSDGSAFRSEQENEIEKIISANNLKKVSWDLIKKSHSEDFSEDYIQFVSGAVEISKRFKVALDCGNAACSIISPLVLGEYAEKLETISTQANGIFPRGLEPSKENLAKLSQLVRKSKSDLGLAHDGDGDRVALVDEKGNFVHPDKLLALLMKNELEGTAGHKVVVPIDTSKLIENVAAEYDAHIIYSKVGDVSVAEQLKKVNGAFGGEPSGTFIFPKTYLCPDGILSALKVLEFLSGQEKKVSELVAELPKYHTIREVVKCKDQNERSKTYKNLSEKIKNLRSAKINEIDGIRADFPDGWILVRPSGTEPKVRITAEAKTLSRAKELLKKVRF